jgi:DNA methylase
MSKKTVAARRKSVPAAPKREQVPDLSSWGDEMSRELAEMTDFKKIKAIRDKAEGFKMYATAAKDPKYVEKAIRIYYVAKDNMGRVIKEMRKRKELVDAKGASGKATAKAKNSLSPEDRVKTWADLEVTPKQGNGCVWFHNLPKLEKEARVEKSVDKAMRSLGAVFRQASDDERRRILHHHVENTPGLHVGDFRELSPEVIADESVELVFTDPPYDRDSVPLYGAAAAEAARILKPGGSMLIYSGHVNLLTVLNAMAEHLDYYWHCVTLHPGKNNQIIRYGIESGFKPILWFVKQHRGDVQTFVHDVVTGERQKDVHEWQQHIEDAEYYIDKLVSENGTVVDFCVGGGTTFVAAKKLGRQWIGFEIDKETAKAASQRLESVGVDDGVPSADDLLTVFQQIDPQRSMVDDDAA